MTATISGDGTSTLINLTTSGNTILGDASTDTLNVGNGGLVKDASGNVGIGTASPVSKLHIESASAESFQIGYSSTKRSRIGTTSAGDTQIYAYETGVGYKNVLLAVDAGTSAGNVGIGTSSPAYKLDVAGVGRFVSTNTMFINPSYDTGVTAVQVLSNAALAFATNNTERARIDSSGNLLVGTTTVGLVNGGIQSQPNGNTTNVPFFANSGNSSSNTYFTFALYSTSASQYQFYVGYGGTVYARSTSITGLSDKREKENIKPLDVGLNEVLALQPRRFDWKDGSASNVAGFIAQEVEVVLPDLVEEYKLNEEETRLGLKMGDMIPTLVKAIQELKALVDTQASTITALQADVEALKAQP